MASGSANRSRRPSVGPDDHADAIGRLDESIIMATQQIISNINAVSQRQKMTTIKVKEALERGEL